ncbi:hypothetical protein BHM03_00038786, partial [Ensete ventricosum]
ALAATPVTGVIAPAGGRAGRCAGGRPLRAAAPAGGRPLQGAWPQPAAPCREIVYLGIPDPDGEDEGGQASSSIAVSTRWIFAVKLLQSDLATLAQKEGGE